MLELLDEKWNTELCEPAWKYENFAKVDIACQVMKGIRRLSRNSECVRDLEKIAFVGVESGFVTLKKRAGENIPTASCQEGFTGCKHPSCSI